MVNELWTTAELKQAWANWLQFRKEKKLPKYVPIGEKATITELTNLSGGDEQKAIAIINQSMVNNWKGFFPLKQQHANQSNRQSAQSGQEQLYNTVREFISSEGGGSENISPAS